MRSPFGAACKAAALESVRLTESRMFDDLQMIMTSAEKKDTEEDRDKGTRGMMWAGDGRRDGQPHIW